MRQDPTRALRRHHVQRLKHARKTYYGRDSKGPDAMPEWELHRVVNTPTPCSCSGCGNPRRHSWFKGERLTVQERRWGEQYKEQVTEWFNDDVILD